MVIGGFIMESKQYALIDKETNIVVGTCMWDGDTSTWQPPATQYAISEDSCNYLVWTLNADKTDWTLEPADPFFSGSELGTLYDGTNFVTQEPKPEQPVSTGTQTV